MYVEALFHSTFIPRLNRLSILKNISVTKRFMDESNIQGCTLVHGDEVLHLFQGEATAVANLKSVLTEHFKDFHIQELGSEPIKRMDFDTWEIFCDQCESAAIMFHEHVIDQASFEAKYLKSSKIRSKVFPFVAESILGRSEMKRAM